MAKYDGYFNIDAYLERIGYTGPRTPSYPVLRDLHVQHLVRVPFENLGLHCDQPILLDMQHFYRKIVLQHRGGVCVELNGLFYRLLRELGFEVEMYPGSVCWDNTNFGPDYEHLVLVVTLDKRWLVDVGYGNLFLEPLLLDEEEPQEQQLGAFQIRRRNDYLELWRIDIEGNWAPRYRFAMNPCQLAEYQERLEYFETSPDSIYLQKIVCTRATPNGRMTLTPGKFQKINVDRTQDVQELENKEQFFEILEKEFAISRATLGTLPEKL
jgi:N-hydroxyarylamine O-acetyltransferase